MCSSIRPTVRQVELFLVSVLASLFLLLPVPCHSVDNDWNAYKNRPSPIRIELSSTSSPPGNPADIQFLLINDGNDTEKIFLRLSNENGHSYDKITEPKFTNTTLEPMTWKEIQINWGGNKTATTGNKLCLRAFRSEDMNEIASKTIPFQPYRRTRNTSPSYCYNREAIGNCGSRDNNIKIGNETLRNCSDYEWEGFATILGSLEIRSIPTGLYVPNATTLATMSNSSKPGRRQARVRVSVKANCCSYFVRIVSGDPYTNPLSSTCIVDIRQKESYKLE